jgi:hypothetical protein
MNDQQRVRERTAGLRIYGDAIVSERFNVPVPLVSIREDVNAHGRCFRSRVRMRQRARMTGL